MSLPEFYLLPGQRSDAASRGRDVLCRIRDALLLARDRKAFPDSVAVSEATRADILAFWLVHFPSAAAHDLPMGMMGLKFECHQLGGRPFAFGYFPRH